MATGEIDDFEYVTQYVFKENPPRNVPRSSDVDGLSAIRGYLSLEDAAPYVRRRGLIFDGDSVRHARVGALRAAGFTVTASPSRRNPIHVSLSREAEWSHSEATQFDQCFDKGVSDHGTDASDH